MAEEVKAVPAAPAAQTPPDKTGAKYVLRAIAAQAYVDAYEAKERGEKIGWCASNFPQEILETLGIKAVYPENQAAAISAKHGGEAMCQHCEGEMGFSNDLCAYARISMAYADLKACPNGEQDMPMPDFVLCCTNICSCMMYWYENLAYELNVPLIMIDIPFNDTYNTDDKHAAYVRAQFEAAIKQLEEITGKKWDDDRFQEVMAISQRSAKAWLEAASYTGYEPSPLNGFDLFNHMAVATIARGRLEAAEAFEQLAAEYRQNVADHKSTYKVPEQYRILFEGIACWPHLRATSGPLKERGINVTATVYAAAFGILYENTTELMKAYATVPNCINLERATKLREDACVAGKVDGALIHINRSCKLWSGISLEMGRRIERDLGIPVVTFDGDQADARNFSAAQYETRVEGLTEIMAANKAKGAR